MLLRSPRKYVVKTTMKQLNLSKQEAEKRVDALLESGILEGGDPNDTWYQLMIENFLRFDLSNLDYRDVFFQTTNFPALIAEYDKRENQHLTKSLEEIRSGKDYNWQDVKTQFETFDRFFVKNIWNYFPGVTKL